jgi:hypothetical protein
MRDRGVVLHAVRPGSRVLDGETGDRLIPGHARNVSARFGAHTIGESSWIRLIPGR